MFKTTHVQASFLLSAVAAGRRGGWAPARIHGGPGSPAGRGFRLPAAPGAFGPRQELRDIFSTRLSNLVFFGSGPGGGPSDRAWRRSRSKDDAFGGLGGSIPAMIDFILSSSISKSLSVVG